IPRPRNAFMLFRSAFAAAQKITANIERDNRHITRIIAHCWNRLSDVEKQIWHDKAAAEKVQHAERYPDYHFTPVGRAKKPKKR
ncbi:high mobility group box domain-containing protein, partial [Boletus edulis BED1]